MSEVSRHSEIIIRELRSRDDLRQIESVEREVWDLADIDIIPLAFAIASREAGGLWIGAFDGATMIGFAFGFLAQEHGELTIHSHMLAVHPSHRDADLGFRLKLAQRELALALRIRDTRLAAKGLEVRVNDMTWTFDPLHSRNAHLNFAKLGVVAERYIENFYGPQTSSTLHRNGTDRLWVRWPMSSQRVHHRMKGTNHRAGWQEALSTIVPLVRFEGDSRPVRSDLLAAVSRHRVAIEIPTDIVSLEKKDFELAVEWRAATRWAFTQAIQAGFFVAEFCRTIRGQQGPGAYLLQKGSASGYVE